jgi:WD40 repeat protein
MPYLGAFAGESTPYISVVNAATARLLPRPTTLPTGAARGCAFSPDGALLAVAHAVNPYITIYNTSDWSKVANPAQLPPTNAAGYGCAFSPDGALLAVAIQFSPYIFIYNTSDWSKVANPAQLPSSTGNGCAFSPDGALLAVAHAGSPFVTIYNTSDWSKVANPAQLPTNTGYGCAFSPDGALLAVAHASGPGITIYNTSDWSTTDRVVPMHGTLRAVSFSATGALTIKGEVRDIDGLVASRKVRAYVRSSGDLCAETTSSAIDGTYELKVYEGNVEYDIQFMADPLENLNDLFYARTTGGTVP